MKDGISRITAVICIGFTWLAFMSIKGAFSFIKGLSQMSWEGFPFFTVLALKLYHLKIPLILVIAGTIYLILIELQVDRLATKLVVQIIHLCVWLLLVSFFLVAWVLPFLDFYSQLVH